MKKIPTLFQRDPNDMRGVIPQINPGCEWVIAGEGTATRKWDGSACLVLEGELYKRYEVKKGKVPPRNFIPADEVDRNTGKQPGWVPVGAGPEDKYHREAFFDKGPFDEGTYELCGPKVQGNPEHFHGHVLLEHSKAPEILSAPREYASLRSFLCDVDIEGIVWHHADGRMAKLKKRDFGFRRQS